MYGGIMPETPAWLVHYAGHRDNESVLPDEDTPAWHELAYGYADAAVSDGVLTITCLDNESAVRYWLEEDGFADGAGIVMEAMVNITASSDGADTGLLLEICDGESQFALWLRGDGLNINEQPHVARSLGGGLRRVVLVAQGITCRVYIDNEFVQDGPLTALVAEKCIGFGTVLGSGFVTAQVLWVKARAFYAWETLADGGYIMQIGPYDETVLDLPKYDPAEPGSSLDPDSLTCCWRVLEVDHSVEAQFTLAEPPVIKDANGDDLDEDDVLITVLPGSDGSIFRVLVMNMGSDGNVAYSEDSDIAFTWTRKGLVEV